MGGEFSDVSFTAEPFTKQIERIDDVVMEFLASFGGSSDIGIEQLKQAMPLMWDDQKKMFGME